MPIVSKTGRRHPRVKLLFAAMYAVLGLGALTMVVPFLLMVAGSTKSAVDAKAVEVVPRYLRDDEALYRKHLEGLFNESLDLLNATYGTEFRSFDAVTPPPAVAAPLEEAWDAFRRTPGALPDWMRASGCLQANVSRSVPSQLRAFRDRLRARHGGDIGALNRERGTDFGGWNDLYVVAENYLTRAKSPADEPLAEDLEAFKREQPDGLQFWFSVEGFFVTQFLKAQYGRDLADVSRAHGTSYASWDAIRLPRAAPPPGDPMRKDWETFVRTTLNPVWVRGGDPETAPLESLRIDSVETRFRDALAARFGTVEALNAAWGTSFDGFDAIRPPQRERHRSWFLAHRGELRREFTTRNYRVVLDYIAVHGRGVRNTAIYCALSVLCALIFNPMAAYALSRHRPPWRYKMLLFMMLTMAFPPMVTQIPVFLMLRELGLLNTFAALILPGLANGYSIFLLKGFFDSLPRELYESAQLDGAGEWTMFWTITMRLSTPVLSVVALHAFTAAYANFMFALLLCQDPSMWTIMVWLYELQQRMGTGVVHASLILAAIPTLLIFLFCQKIILRGIVVPVEK